MTKNILFIITVFCISTAVRAQVSSCSYVPGPNYCSNSLHNSSFKRGLFVDDFLRMLGSSSNVNPALSILGVDDNSDGIFEKENELLQYCVDNGFTSLVLYNIDFILIHANDMYNGAGSETYSESLRKFIYKAKTSYQITEISASVGNFFYWHQILKFNNTFLNNINCVQSSQDFEVVDYPHQVDFQNYNYQGECVDLVKRIHNFNLQSCIDYGEGNQANRNISCAKNYILDRMTTEFEFWGNPASIGYSTNQEAWLGFQNLLSNMFCARMTSICPLKVDVYIGWLDLDGNIGQFNDQVQADYLDKYVDRINIHAYKCQPTQLFGYARTRINLFGNNSYNSAEIWPIFSAESFSLPGWYDAIDHPNLNIDDYLGQFLTDNSVMFNPLGGYTMACAENQFISDYISSGSSSWTNNFNGFQWFTYTVLKKNASHEIKRLHSPETNINTIDFSLLNDQLTIMLNNEMTNGKIEVLNSSGQIILVKKIIDGENVVSFPMSQYENGIYFISVKSDKINNNRKFALVH